MKAAPSTPYNETFFDKLVHGAHSSARAVMPVVLDLVPASSVVDFGCGQGAWLKACLENGIETVLGLDGDYVNRDKLLVDREQFRAFDLTRTVRLDRRFDLALCLEVAEHLPARSAPVLVESLAAAAPVVLFSAALPRQGGVHHINEQWPTYWEHLFAAHGMRKYDVIRPLIWHDHSIDWWYRQNLYLFTKDSDERLDSLKRFEPEFSIVWKGVMAEIETRSGRRDVRRPSLLRRVRSRLDRFTRVLSGK